MQPILRPHYTKSGKAGRLERVDNIRFSGQLEFRGILRGLAYWLTGFPTAPFLLFFFCFFHSWSRPSRYANQTSTLQYLVLSSSGFYAGQFFGFGG